MSGKDLFWMMMPGAIIVTVLCVTESCHKYLLTKEKVLKHMIDKCTNCNDKKHCNVCAATIAGFVGNRQEYKVTIGESIETTTNYQKNYILLYNFFNDFYYLQV